ncbi:MAG: HAD hydrolase family protein [Phycisphaerales bacterium]|nr:HAD hydrolase family protein [Phycisphaerales bacterium]
MTPANPHANPGKVRLLTLDVDGVLTDGSILIDDLGREAKRFHVRDGAGIRMWIKTGRQVAIITGRRGMAVTHRAAELGIALVYQGRLDKAAVLREIAEKTGIEPEATAHVGDDLPDLPVMRMVGYPIAVGDAVDAVRNAAAHVTERPGGHGAVREAIEHLLGAAGELDAIAARYGAE